MNVMRRVCDADGKENMKRRMEKWNKKWKEIEKYSIEEKHEMENEDIMGTER